METTLQSSRFLQRRCLEDSFNNGSSPGNSLEIGRLVGCKEALVCYWAGQKKAEGKVFTIPD